VPKEVPDLVNEPVSKLQEVKTMKHLSPKERLEFVQNLELDEPKMQTRDMPSAPEITPNNTANYVNDGSLISFVAGLSTEDKSDVLNSVLLAQRAANKKHDRYTDSVAWYADYREILTTIGWVGGADTFQKYTATGGTVKVDDVVLQILGTLAIGGAAITAITQALSALQGLSEHDKQFTLWEQASHSLTTGNFQIAACEKSDDGLVLNLGTFYFSATQTATRFLFFDYSSTSITLFTGGQTMVLNKEVYAQIRKDVMTKLARLASEFVANLPDLE
jgi:hypothetical protein